MQFRIVGSSRSTGEPVDIVIEALDEAAAGRAADGMGVAAASITPAAAAPAGFGPPGGIPSPYPQQAGPGGYQPLPPPPAGAAGWLNQRVIGIGVAALALVAVIVTLFLVLGGSSGIKGLKHMIPDKPAVVMFTNFDAFRDTDFWRDWSKAARNDDQRSLSGLKVKLDDVAEMFGATDHKDSGCVIIKTRTNMTLDDLVKKRKDTQKYEGYEYYRGDNERNGVVYVTKLGSRLYLVMQGGDKSDRDFEDFIRRYKEKKDPGLATDVEKAINYVAGDPFTFIIVAPKGTDKAEAQVIGLGATIGNEVKLKGTLIFNSEKDAGEAIKKIKDGLKETRAIKAPKDGSQEAVGKLLANGMEFTQSAEEIRITGSWLYSDIRKATDGDPRLLLKFMEQAGK